MQTEHGRKRGKNRQSEVSRAGALDFKWWKRRSERERRFLGGKVTIGFGLAWLCWAVGRCNHWPRFDYLALPLASWLCLGRQDRASRLYEIRLGPGTPEVPTIRNP
jgi:hypothetical protein